MDRVLLQLTANTPVLPQEVMRGGTVLVLFNMGDARTLSRPWLTSERIEAVLGLHGMGLRHWRATLCTLCCVPQRRRRVAALEGPCPAVLPFLQRLQ